MARSDEKMADRNPQRPAPNKAPSETGQTFPNRLTRREFIEASTKLVRVGSLFYVGMFTLSSRTLAQLGDINGDGRISVADITALIASGEANEDDLARLIEETFGTGGYG
jgi:hypothetical protein